MSQLKIVMSRNKGQELTQRYAIPYDTIKNIIENCSDSRTRALLAYQYGLGTRAGELAKEYTHYLNSYFLKPQDKRRPKKDVVNTQGIRLDDIEVLNDIIRVRRPNFKQHKKNPSIVPQWVGFVLRDNEEWLFARLYQWFYNRKNTGEEFLFDLKRSRIMGLIDEELKKYNPLWSSHWLRHSRATHIGYLTGDPMAVNKLLGHARMETSMKYINYTESVLRKRLGKQSFSNVLGGGLSV